MMYKRELRNSYGMRIDYHCQRPHATIPLAVTGPSVRVPRFDFKAILVAYAVHLRDNSYRDDLRHPWRARMRLTRHGL